MKSYAFPVELNDIYDVLLQLRNIGAVWGADGDPIDYFEARIKHQFKNKEGIALYIKWKNSKYRILYSSITYLKEEFCSESDSKFYTIVDSFYSIQEFASYSDLEDNTINFCEI